MKEKPSYYSIIPADVRYDKTLTPLAKLLYSEITSLSNSFGYCCAGNKYFAELYDVSEREVIRLIKSLEEKSYIKIDRTSKPRKIYISSVVKVTEMSLYSDKNVTSQGDKNVTHNNTSININNNISSEHEAQEQALVKLPLKDNTFFSVTEAVLKHYAELYPSIDLKTEFKKMLDWLNNNPNKRKIKINSFISRWLNKVQSNAQPQGNTINYAYSAESEADNDFKERKAMIENGYY